MKMFYVYAAGILAALLYAAGVLGGRVATEKCRAQHARDVAAATAQIMKTQGDVHEKVLHMATRDIRRGLRAKYTIAD